MNLKLTQSQARLLKECIKLYDTQLLTSSEDWRDYDKLFERALEKKIRMFYEALKWDMPVDKANTLERFF